MDLPFIAFTSSATFFLDHAGVCRRVEPANGKRFSSTKAEAEALRCLHAEYVIAQGVAGFVEQPAAGTVIVFRARDPQTHTSYLVRTDMLVRFHARTNGAVLVPFRGAAAPAESDVELVSHRDPMARASQSDSYSSVRGLHVAPAASRPAPRAPAQSVRARETETTLYVSDEELETMTGTDAVRTPTMRKLLPMVPKFGPVTPPGLPIYRVRMVKKTA